MIHLFGSGFGHSGSTRNVGTCRPLTPLAARVEAPAPPAPRQAESRDTARLLVKFDLQSFVAGPQHPLHAARLRAPSPRAARGSFAGILPLQDACAFEAELFPLSGRLCHRPRDETPRNRACEMVWPLRLTAALMARDLMAQNPFDTIESTHEYLKLLDEVLEEVQATTEEELKRIVLADTMVISRSVEAMHLLSLQDRTVEASRQGEQPHPERSPHHAAPAAGRTQGRQQ